jgi:predicted transcriptional regulator
MRNEYTVSDFNALCEREVFLEEIALGLSDAVSGRVMPVLEVREQLAEYRKNR